MNYITKFFKYGGEATKWTGIIIACYLGFHLIQPIALIAFACLLFGGFFYWIYRLLRFIVLTVWNIFNT